LIVIRIDIILGVYFEIFFTGVPEFISEAIAAAEARKAPAASCWGWQVIG